MVSARKLPNGGIIVREGNDEKDYLYLANLMEINSTDIHEIRKGVKESLSSDPEKFLSKLNALSKLPPHKRGILLEFVAGIVSNRLWKAIKGECAKKEKNFYEVMSQIQSPLLHGKVPEKKIKYEGRLGTLLNITQTLANFEEKTLQFYFQRSNEKDYIIPHLKKVKIKGGTILLNPETGRWVITDKPELIEGSRYKPRVYTRITMPGGKAFIQGGILNEEEKKFFEALEKEKVVYSSKQSLTPLMNFRIMPTILTILLTMKCNYGCDYCYEKHAPYPELSTEELDKKVEEILNKFDTIRTVQFFGGEPLLRLKTIRYLLLNELVMSKKTVIQTNGSLITPEVARLFKLKNVSVGVSLDGPGKYNKLRKTREGNSENALEKTMNGINNLKKEKVRFGIISVLTKNNVTMQDDLFKWLDEIKPSSFHFNIVVDKKLMPSANKLFNFVSKTFEEYVEKEYYKKVKYDNFKWMAESITQPMEKREFMCARSPCGAGSSLLVLLPDGKMAPCPRLLQHTSNKPPEDVFNDFWGVYKTNILTSERCKNCEYKKICAGGCTARQLNSPETMDEYCGFQKKIIPWFIERLYNNPKYTEALKSWKKLKPTPITLAI